ncbi:hypothetical protein [Alcaligenes sp. Marseille-Q7550]
MSWTTRRIWLIRGDATTCTSVEEIRPVGERQGCGLAFLMRDSLGFSRRKGGAQEKLQKKIQKLLKTACGKGFVAFLQLTYRMFIGIKCGKKLFLMAKTRRMASVL